MVHKKLPENYFEIYRLAVNMADKVSARRTAANTFFITLHGVLSSFLGLLIRDLNENESANPWVLIVFGIVGLVLSATWWIMLRSYRDLNSAKFKVINEMEEKLPVAPFTAEWKHLKKDPVSRWRGRYAELTSVEKLIPVLFGLVYVAIIILEVCER